ncbi:uncharacterized protein B0H18DRAFT_1142467 [Fomitopsis serialis]|uniref:uncharacterized protein n=1 Tax=Fomitopsis serialis TaxID=139415 RepID=UPI0020079441|nr:uncharacterized protein B0H18DRAFT_1142467 [Neoantrodia serialis]KAH9915136.1 hypothetical protein B0H18DRAFT_1142467 [Neoantrodia serialis]
MSQLEDLARCLTSSGYAPHPEGEGTYVLYTDDGSAILKHWTGDSFGNEELLTSSVRPGSTAAYIPTPDGGILAYITDSSAVAVLQFDEDEEEWVDADNLPRCEVHADGQLTASLDPAGEVVITFQDNAGRLMCLHEAGEGESWTTTEIEGAQKPARGTPLSIRVDPDTLALEVFYVCADDSAIHMVVNEHGGMLWTDVVVLATGCGSPFKRVLVTKRPDQAGFTAYALTCADTILQLVAGEAGHELGRVNKDGSVVASTTAECCIVIFGLEIKLQFNLQIGASPARKRRFFG